MPSLGSTNNSDSDIGVNDVHISVENAVEDSNHIENAATVNITEDVLDGANCSNGGGISVETAAEGIVTNIVENAIQGIVTNDISALNESELNALQFGGNLQQNLPQELEFIVHQNYNDHSMMT